MAGGKTVEHVKIDDKENKKIKNTVLNSFVFFFTHTVFFNNHKYCFKGQRSNPSHLNLVGLSGIRTHDNLLCRQER